jgi:protease-4
MSRFLKFLSFLALAAVTVGVAYVAFVRRGVSVESNSTLYLRLDAPMSEAGTTSVLSPFLPERATLRDMVATLERARVDDRVTGVVITPVSSGAMWGQLQELRAAVVDVRKAGKPVTAYLESGGAPEYYIASAADRVLLMPGGTLDLSGVATYELFFRGTLDKLGIVPDLLHVGEYKTAANTFTQSSMTPAHREMNTSLNREMYNELVRAIADGRGRSEADIRTTLDRGPFLGAEAVAAGLVDALAYEDQIDDTAPVAGTHRIDGDDYGLHGESPSFRAPKIALIYAAGEIVSGESTSQPTGGSVVGSDTFVDWIRSARADRSVRAIVIRIDSPGGSAVASEVIWRELMLTRDVKPLIVSMGDVAASGGYYIAVPAHAIVAEPGTLTGSIGVVTGKFVVADALKKLGIGTGVVADGAMAEINSPFREFTTAERAKVETQMQATYSDFVAKVAQARNSTPQKIDAIAQGRVWTGRQARELGLVDALGGLTDAIALAKSRAHIDASTRVSLQVYPTHRGWLDLVSNPFGPVSADGMLSRGTLTRAALMLAQVRRYRPGEPLMIMPNIFTASWK